MFCYKDQSDPACTTTQHNIFNLALSGHSFSWLKCDRVATRFPWLMPIKYWLFICSSAPCDLTALLYCLNLSTQILPGPCLLRQEPGFFTLVLSSTKCADFTKTQFCTYLFCYVIISLGWSKTLLYV